MLLCVYIKPVYYEILFGANLYDLGCMWVLGVHFDVFKIAYFMISDC